MKPIRVAMAILVALTTTAALAQGENPQTRREIESVFQKWDMLVAKQDVNGLLAMVDKSFTMTSANGQVMYFPEAKQQLITGFRTMHNTRCMTTVNQIQDQGNEVVAWITVKSNFMQKQGSRWVAMTKTMRFAETLRRSGGTWKFVASQELPPQ